jgi:UDP-N-acetylmuramoyl-tripeptide--D-alanyl-D-alanine ligase
MTLIPAIKNSFVIDDTYNSSPISAEAALDVVEKIEAPRKIVVMGDMLELGRDSEAGHKAVIKKFLSIKGDIFFAVGSRMEQAAKEFKRRPWAKEGLFLFPDPISAGKELQKIIKKGDLILVKGSQGMRMEKVVEEVMAEPEKAGNLLTRQDETWKKKPWQKV